MPLSVGIGLRNGWTGGQYSVFRAIFGAYLLVHFGQLLPWAPELFSSRGVLPEAATSPLLVLFPNVLALIDAPWFVTLLVGVAAALCVPFAIGRGDRAAAVGLWYVLACLFGRNPLIANPSLPYVGWLLLAHACVPPAPYGSWAARRRVDPAGGWRMPPALFGSAWVLMALGYSYSGYTKLISPSWRDGTALARVLDNPLARPGLPRDAALALPEELTRVATWGALGFELLFAPLALLRPLRPWLWAAMLSMHLALIVLIDFADLSLGMAMLHLFTFDPAWIRPARSGAAAATLFYDGTCGLCHRAVRFALAEDPESATLRFAPLGGATFRSEVNGERARDLPDSLVLRTADGRLRVRSAAVRALLARLGGLWRVLAAAAGVVPARVLDAAYDGLASVRHRLFRRPPDVCPVLPASLRARFDP